MSNRIAGMRKGFMSFSEECRKEGDFINLNSKYKISQTYGHDIRGIFFLGYDYEGQQYSVPPYQRNLVWTIKQKEELIISILKGLPIGDFLFAVTNHNLFEPIDGQQRVNAIRGFILDEFKVETPLGPKTFSELKYTDRYSFLGYKTTTNSINNITQDEQAEIYIQMNSSGTNHTPEEIKKAKEELL